MDFDEFISIVKDLPGFHYTIFEGKEVKALSEPTIKEGTKL